MIINILIAMILFYIGTATGIAFLFPVYMIRMTLQNENRHAQIVHSVVYSIIFTTSLAMGEDRILLMIFIGIYAIIEIIYFCFKKFDIIGTFDKMVVISTMTSSFVILVFYLNREFFQKIFDMIKLFYEEAWKMPQELIDVYNQIAAEQAIYILFTYLFIMIGITYLVIERVTLPSWEISYLYLVLYIVSVVLTDIFKIENVIINNMMKSLRFVYIIYGVKVVYYYLKSKLKYNFVITLIVVLLTNLFPIGAFIVGALKSFNLKLGLERTSKS